jgi:hypothetical protein
MNAPRRFRKRPVEIEAMQWTANNAEAMLCWMGDKFATICPDDRTDDPDATAQIWVAANGRWLPIVNGEWVARDSEGFYPIKDSVFGKSYEILPVA